MDKTKLPVGRFEIPPLRSLNDFLWGSARFQLPNLKDQEKWGNRVVNNLQYYQSNYFFMAIIIFVIVWFMHPVKMLIGMITMTVILGVCAYVYSEDVYSVRTKYFKKQYPVAGVILIILAACFVTYTLKSLAVFLLGILLPFVLSIVHASLRLRNFKNKIVNNIDDIGLKRTPMGVFLSYFEDVSGMTIRPQTSIMQLLHH